MLEQDAGTGSSSAFTANPRAAAFQTQLYFLFQRSRQLQDLRQSDLFENVRVADYMLEKDRLFARLTLDDEEFALYEQVYERLAIDAPTPDLIVYLQAPADVLLERIAHRGIEYEQQIERRYLERLTEGYARFFLEYDAAPVLIVNAAEIDPIGNEADYQALLAEIVRPRKGRHTSTRSRTCCRPGTLLALMFGAAPSSCGLARGALCTPNCNCGIRRVRPSPWPRWAA